MFLERDENRISPRAAVLRRKDRLLYTHLPYMMEVDDEVVRSRDNALMLSLEVTGIDGFTSAPQTISALRRQLAQLLDGLDDRFTFYIHRMMKKSVVGLKPLMGRASLRMSRPPGDPILAARTCKSLCW